MPLTKTSFKKGECSKEKHPRWKGGVSLKSGYNKTHARAVRNAVLEALGGECVNCGFKDKRALQIDHINGDGTKERTNIKFSRLGFHKKVIESFLNKENKYQLLCANCNWIKKYENNEISGITKRNLINKR